MIIYTNNKKRKNERIFDLYTLSDGENDATRKNKLSKTAYTMRLVTDAKNSNKPLFLAHLTHYDNTTEAVYFHNLASLKEFTHKANANSLELFAIQPTQPINLNKAILCATLDLQHNLTALDDIKMRKKSTKKALQNATDEMQKIDLKNLLKTLKNEYDKQYNTSVLKIADKLKKLKLLNGVYNFEAIRLNNAILKNVHY